MKIKEYSIEDKIKNIRTLESKASAFADLIRTVNLNDMDKRVIMQRFIQELHESEQERKNFKYLHDIGNSFIQIGGLVIPALLSITQLNSSPGFFWGTWGVSLAVGITTNLLSLFRINSKYTLLTKHVNALSSEGFRFFGLSSPYIFKEHGNAVSLFLTRIERFIKLENKAEIGQINKKNRRTNNNNDSSSNHTPPVLSEEKKKIITIHSRVPSNKMSPILSSDPKERKLPPFILTNPIKELNDENQERLIGIDEEGGKIIFETK